MGRFLDIDPSSWLESHTKGRTTPLGADHLLSVGVVHTLMDVEQFFRAAPSLAGTPRT
ncbi:protein of unknown function [Methylorubrum extorquens]|uniref:Uncharacterized protein n=1 Tax=Methylorubrum extorquens TaxID=408 RepID=A0A2N9AN64_METEX|nr:protein of unknown function [Methylorubrum extorquens]